MLVFLSRKLLWAVVIFTTAICGGWMPYITFYLNGSNSKSWSSSDDIVPILTAFAGGVCFSVGNFMVRDAAQQVHPTSELFRFISLKINPQDAASQQHSDNKLSIASSLTTSHPAAKELDEYVGTNVGKWSKDDVYNSMLLAEVVMVLSFAATFCLEKLGDKIKDMHLDRISRQENNENACQSTYQQNDNNLPNALNENNESAGTPKEIVIFTCQNNSASAQTSQSLREPLLSDIPCGKHQWRNVPYTLSVAKGKNGENYREEEEEEMDEKLRWQAADACGDSIEIDEQAEAVLSNVPSRGSGQTGQTLYLSKLSREVTLPAGTQGFTITDRLASILSDKLSKPTNFALQGLTQPEESRKVSARKVERRRRKPRGWRDPTKVQSDDDSNLVVQCESSGIRTKYKDAKDDYTNGTFVPNYERDGRYCSVSDDLCYGCDSDLDVTCPDFEDDAHCCHRKTKMHLPHLETNTSKALQIIGLSTASVIEGKKLHDSWQQVSPKVTWYKHTCEGKEESNYLCEASTDFASSGLRQLLPNEHFKWSQTSPTNDPKYIQRKSENEISPHVPSDHSHLQPHISNETLSFTVDTAQPNNQATTESKLEFGGSHSVVPRLPRLLSKSPITTSERTVQLHCHHSSPTVANSSLSVASSRIENLIIASILFFLFSAHSLLEGIGLGSSDRSEATIGIGILLHKGIAAFTVGVSFLECGMSVGSFAMSTSLFAAMTPVGVLIGSLAHHCDASGSSRGFLTAIAAGAFIFISVCELIPKAFKRRKHRMLKSLSLVSGCGIVCWTAIVNAA